MTGTDGYLLVQDEITDIIGTLASGYGGRLGKAWRDRSKSAGLESFVALTISSAP
jgi:hypothetical protein